MFSICSVVATFSFNNVEMIYGCPPQWTQLKTRKQNLTRLFRRMQSYQFEQISADPDKPLADSTRPLDTADMERYKYKPKNHSKMLCFVHSNHTLFLH